MALSSNNASTLPFVAPDLRVENRDDGSILIWQEQALLDVGPSIAHLFVARAREIPDRVFVAQPNAKGGWETITYGQLLDRALRIAAAFAARGYLPGDRVLILTGPGIDHAAVMFGAMLARLVTLPLSPAYAVVAERLRLEYAVELVRPVAAFADNAAACGDALRDLRDANIATLSSSDGSLAAFEQNAIPVDADQALNEIDANTVFKLLLTSGSTAMPKAVIQTHGMSCASLAFEAAMSTLPFGVREPQVVLDWMPWSHVGGGITIFNNILFSGASLYLDQGRPVPGQFDASIRNLKSFPQEVYGTLPIGLAMLADAMDRDEELRSSFFSRLLYIKSGGAALPEELRRHFQGHAMHEIGREIPILMAYGTTETHGVLSVTQESQRAFLLGLPKPGVLAKLAPSAAGFELRIKSASVTPGYFADQAATAAAFDEEGFFCTGDGVMIDPDGLGAGLVFTGRSGDNFKIASGTWVSAAELRAAVLDALDGEASDCVIVGEGQMQVGAFIWCDDEPERRGRIIALLKQYNDGATGESRRVGRALFSEVPISGERFERTEKGSLNRTLIIANRAAEMVRLYGDISEDVVDLKNWEGK